MASTAETAGVTESSLYGPLMAHWTQRGHRLFRNNVGQAWLGRVFARHGNRVTLDCAHKIPFGLATGSGDLIGWTRVRVTPDMVGHELAVFTSVECKSYAAGSHLQGKQKNWYNTVREAGGIAVVAMEQGAADLALAAFRARFTLSGPRATKP